MKPFPIPVLMVLAFLCAPAWAEEVRFRPAYHLTDAGAPPAADAGDAAILFDDFLNTDWERLAQDHFAAYPLTGLSQSQISELAGMSPYYDVAVPYPAPMTEDYRRARFVFLSADGMRRLYATGLRGAVIYGLTRDRTAIDRVTHFGQVLGKPDPDNAPGGGFVAMLGQGQELVSETIVGPENPALAAVDPLPGLGAAMQIEYRFSGDDHTYLFVRYEADSACDYGCCQFIYKLFRAEPGSGQLTQVQSSMYGCDV